jgi:hypothetical protein
VGEPGQDILKITYALATKNSLVVFGTSTVNPGTGQMASTVSIFAGQGTGGPKIGDAPVDPISGAWSITTTVTTVPDNITAVSSGGGTYGAIVSKTPLPLTTKTTAPVNPESKMAVRDTTSDFKPTDKTPPYQSRVSPISGSFRPLTPEQELEYRKLAEQKK